MKTYSVVLFDLDGTLIDTNHLIVTSFQHVFRECLNLSVEAKEIVPYFGEPLVTTLARYSPERAEELTTRYRTFNEAHHDELIRQFADVKEMLADLKEAGVKTAVVTSKRRAMALRGLRISGLEDLMDTVVGVDETERHKPEAEPALLALQRLGEEPGAHALMVGDSHYDILCGRNAGVKTAAVGWSLQTRETLSASAPDFWVDTPADLSRLVLGR